MKLDSFELTDDGKVRQNNEDAVGKCEPNGETAQAEKGSLYVVADGMGGHRGGEIASKLAVDTIISWYYASESDDAIEALRQSFIKANDVIHRKSIADVELFGMGTTCTTMVLKQGDAFFAHVGDSRAYVLRGGKLKQVTEDHSLVGEMVRSGILSDEDAQNHPKRNVITRSLGTQEELATDFPSSPYKTADGDVFLLCSDGLTTMVTDDEVEAILKANSPRKACKELVELANKKGGKDNVTVQIVKIDSAR
ncbi:MAG: Stp1/IreP family PP2C-type Ser/Thr phosphatase [Candidatus Krumholzibacteriia bacterium]